MAELPTYAVVLLAVLGTVAAAALVTLAVDTWRVFRVVRWYHAPRAPRDKVEAYKKRMEAAYAGIDAATDDKNNPFAHVVTDAEFEDNLRTFESELDAMGAPREAGLMASLDNPYCKLLRESIFVAIAPRAVVLQVAHPFVATGIRQHSNVVRDTPKRFEHTYRYMFGLAFGTRDDCLKFARRLRSIHSRVVGSFPHDVRGGEVPRGRMYTAAHTHAMLYVAIALAESVLLGYLALIGEFSPDEQAQLAKSASLGLLLFGVDKRITTGTYADLRVAVEAMWESNLIGNSPEAEFINHHLLYPKRWLLRPIFAVARWVTLSIMHPRLAKEFFGREPTLVDHVAVSMLGGLARFLYRFVPGPLRYVPEYSAAARRLGRLPYGPWCDPCARGMESVMAVGKDVAMKVVMPPADARAIAAAERTPYEAAASRSRAEAPPPPSPVEP